MRYFFSTVFLLCSLTHSAQLKMTYVGNMGILLEGADQTVLIDGLHQRYGPAYQYPTDSMVTDLLSANGEFPRIQVSLITHYHGDHFNADLCHQLTAALIIGSEQVTNLLKARHFNNTHTVPYRDYQKQAYELRQLKVMAFRMDHVNQKRHGKVQNIGYIIEVGNLKVLHVGDSDWYEDMFETLNLKKESIDIAILPVWMLMDQNSKALLETYIQPRELVVTHIDPAMSKNALDQIQSIFPKARFMRTLGQQIEF